MFARLRCITLGLVMIAWVTGCRSLYWDRDQAVFEYRNPIRNGIEGGIRDAQIFQDNGKYYLVGTCAPFWEGANPGVKVYSSQDILNWKYEGLLIDRSRLDPSVWYFDRFWAPEIHKIRGQYFLLVNCRNESQAYPHAHGCCVAVADHILGPYTVLTDQEPFHAGNDLTFFEDDDGKVYAYWNGPKRMYGAQVDLARMKPVLVEGQKEPQIIFTPEPGTWEAVGIEGPYVIKRRGTYYLFYSSWSRGYEIGYATASHPLGPWTKYAGNPIYGAQSRQACEKHGLPYTGDPNSPFRAVGHNQIWTGPDGRDWISCHGIIEGQSPHLIIDPIEMDKNGVIRAKGPTWTPQTVPHCSKRTIWDLWW